MTDASEIARSELVDADLPLKRTGDREFVSHTAEPNEAARHKTPTAGLAQADIWLRTVDENHRDKIIVQDVQPAGWDAGSLLPIRRLPALAELNQRGGRFLLAPSTVSDILRRNRLPRDTFLSAYVRACGLDDNQAGTWERALAELRQRELIAADPLTALRLAELERELKAIKGILPTAAGVRPILREPGQMCAVFAVDIAGFTRPGRDDDIRLYLHEQLYWILQKAFDDSGLPWAGCFREDRGDGALIVIPPDVAARGIIDPLPGRLRSLIRRHNHVSSQAAEIQLRAAAHIGPVEHDGYGFVGTDVNFAFRMLEARPLKHMLAASGAELGLIVSDYVYRSLICRRPGLVSPDSFQQVRFQVKTTRARAWTFLPGVEPLRAA